MIKVLCFLNIDAATQKYFQTQLNKWCKKDNLEVICASFYQVTTIRFSVINAITTLNIKLSTSTLPSLHVIRRCDWPAKCKAAFA